MVLPDGREVPVNADFRVILKCLRTLKDRKFTDAQKEAFISLYFFNGLGVRNPSHLLNQFLSDGTASEDDGDPPVMDFEQDADVIYSSFMQSYGIDLIDIPFSIGANSMRFWLAWAMKQRWPSCEPSPCGNKQASAGQAGKAGACAAQGTS